MLKKKLKAVNNMSNNQWLLNRDLKNKTKRKCFVRMQKLFFPVKTCHWSWSFQKSLLWLEFSKIASLSELLKNGQKYLNKYLNLQNITSFLYSKNLSFFEQTTVAENAATAHLFLIEQEQNYHRKVICTSAIKWYLQRGCTCDPSLRNNSLLKIRKWGRERERAEIGAK